MPETARHEHAVRRLLRNIEVPAEGGPEERRRRQLDLLKGVRELYARDYDAVPTWIAALKREVEAGRL